MAELSVCHPTVCLACFLTQSTDSSEMPTQTLSHGSNVPQSMGWAGDAQSWMMTFLHKCDHSAVGLRKANLVLLFLLPPSALMLWNKLQTRMSDSHCYLEGTWSSEILFEIVFLGFIPLANVPLFWTQFKRSLDLREGNDSFPLRYYLSLK